MITLTLFLVFYVAAAIVAYQSIRRRYSRSGISYPDPTLIDACIVFIPIANFIICLIDLLDYLAEADARSFFRIDEEEIDEEELLNEVMDEAYAKWKSAHDRRRKKLQKN